MKKEKYILDEAVSSLFRYTKIQAVVKDFRKRHDALLEIANEEFVVEIKSRITKGNKGIILADTKMEFGLVNDQLILIDELLTPDSSRFWDAQYYQAGRSQPSFDKQPLRDWLVASGWNKEPPAPMLPPQIIEETAERYRQAYTRLTGKALEKRRHKDRS